MKLFLQIDIGDWKHSAYSRPLLNYASSLSGDLLGTSLDSQSEPFVVDIALKVIDQAEKIFLFVDIKDPEAPLGSVNKVFNHLLKSRSKVSRAVMSGSHEMAEKILKSSGATFSLENDSDKIKGLIEDYSKS